MKRGIIFICLVLSISMISASYPIFPRPSVDNNFFPNINFSMNFTFERGANTLFSFQEDLTTDSSGVAFLDLNFTLFSVPTNFLHYRNGTLILNKTFPNVIFNKTYSKDILTENISSLTWDNITITESQISNLIHTTDSFVGNYSQFLGLINNDSYLSTYNLTYDGKADYQFVNNNFNGSGNFKTTGNITATNLTIDHIAEKTSGHRVVFDDVIDMNGNNIEDLTGTLTFSIFDGTFKTFVFNADGFSPVASANNLGTVINPWKDLHLSGDANVGGAILGGGAGHNQFSDFVESKHLDHALDLDASLISWWRMDDVDGSNQPTDFTGTNDVDSTVGTPTQEDGVIGKSFTFAGPTEKFIVTSPIDLPLGSSSRTVSMWVQTTTSSKYMFHYGDASGPPGTRYSIISLANGGIRVGTGGGAFHNSVAADLLDGLWHQLTITSGSTTDSIIFYLDGEVVASDTLGSGTFDIQDTALDIGGWSLTTGVDFIGKIDDVMIFSRILDADEAKELYELGTLDAETNFDFAYFKEYIASRSGFFNFVNILTNLNVGGGLVVEGLTIFNSDVDIMADLDVIGTLTADDLEVFDTAIIDFLTVDEDLDVTGKLTVLGGTDPPYVLYDIETRESIVNRARQEITISKAGGMALFYNEDLNRMEYFKALTCEFFVEAYDEKFESYLKLVHTWDDDEQPCYNTKSYVRFYYDRITDTIKNYTKSIYDNTFTDDKILNKETGELEDKIVGV